MPSPIDNKGDIPSKQNKTTPDKAKFERIKEVEEVSPDERKRRYKKDEKFLEQDENISTENVKSKSKDNIYDIAKNQNQKEFNVEGSEKGGTKEPDSDVGSYFTPAPSSPNQEPIINNSLDDNVPSVNNNNENDPINVNIKKTPLDTTHVAKTEKDNAKIKNKEGKDASKKQKTDEKKAADVSALIDKDKKNDKVQSEKIKKNEMEGVTLKDNKQKHETKKDHKDSKLKTDNIQGNAVKVQSDSESHTQQEQKESYFTKLSSKKNPFLDVKKQKNSENEKAVSLPTYDKSQVGNTSIASSSAHAVESYISPEISHILTSCVGVIMQAIKDGVTKTEFTLNSPNFKDSTFYGAKIVVEENTSSAAKNFNIRLIAKDQSAVNLFNNHSDLMFSYFEKNKKRFGFSINEIKAEYDTKYLIKRKESIADEGDSNG